MRFSRKNPQGCFRSLLMLDRIGSRVIQGKQKDTVHCKDYNRKGFIENICWVHYRHIYKDFSGFKKKSLMNLLQYCSWFTFWLYGQEAHGFSAKEMVIQLILSEILIVELVIMLLRPLGSFFQDPYKMLTNHIIRSQTCLAF